MRKFIAVLIVLFIFFPIAFSWMGLLSIRSWALERQFYLDIVDDQRFYEALIYADDGIAVNEVVDTKFAGSINGKALNAALRQVIDPVYVRDQAVRLVNGVFDVLEGKVGAFNLTIDTTPIKTALRGEAGDRAVRAFAENLPTCTGSQTPLQGTNLVPACRAAEQTVSQLESNIREAMPRVITAIPDEIALNEETFRTENSSAFNSSDSISTTVAAAFVRGSIDITAIFLFVAGVVVWLAAAFIGSESWRGRLWWLGGSLLVPAIFFAAVGGSINNPVTSAIMQGAIQNGSFSGIPAVQGIIFRDALSAVTETVTTRVGGGFLNVGIIATGIALALIVIGFFLPGGMDKEKEKFKYG